MAGPVRSKEIEILKERTNALQKKGVTPTLKVILVGNTKASLIYTRSKKKFIENFGARCEIIHLPDTLNEAEFLAEVGNIVGDDSVHGCFVQLPLPRHLSHIDVGELIPGHKDVDGFNQKNLYELFKGDTGVKALLPCTPKGIITLLQHYDIPLDGQNVVILGRSEIVGRPMSLLLLNHNATVTVCHSRTKNIKEITAKADIIISAIGKAKFLDSSFLSEDKRPVIIDVGINHDEAGKLCGDVDYQDVYDHCEAISPVPGGVGPMTILSLAQNLLQATEMSL